MTQSPVASKPVVGSPLTPRLDFNAVPQSKFFLSPRSASTSPQTSTASLRKSLHSTQGPRGTKRSFEAEEAPSQDNALRFQSPPLLTSNRYRLAPGDNGGRTLSNFCQTPNAEDAPSSKRLHGIHRGIQQMDMTQSDDEDAEASKMLFADNRPPIDRPISPGIRDGLGNAIYRVAGIAGKVWQNWSSTFKGFYAGGGPGYEVRQIDWQGGTRDCWQVRQDDAYWRQNALPLTPGGFPQDDFIPDYMSRDHVQETPMRAVKRNRQSSGSAERWVMVGSSQGSESSPSRLSQRKPPRSSNNKRKADMQNGNRRCVLGASQQAINGSPRNPRPSRASIASARLGTPTNSPMRNSPKSAEMQRQTAKIRRKEAEEEANLQRFNLQLKAMIKEGREALGTKFEIEDDLGENARSTGGL